MGEQEGLITVTKIEEKAQHMQPTDCDVDDEFVNSAIEQMRHAKNKM